jgi:hypothetical protein
MLGRDGSGGAGNRACPERQKPPKTARNRPKPPPKNPAPKDYELIDLPGRWMTTVLPERRQGRDFYQERQRACVALDWCSLVGV